LGLIFQPCDPGRGHRVPCLSQVPVGQQLHRSLDTGEHRRALPAFPPGVAQEAKIFSVRCVEVYAWGVYGRGASGRDAAVVVVPVGGHGDCRRLLRAGVACHTRSTSRRRISRMPHKSGSPHGSHVDSAGNACESLCARLRRGRWPGSVRAGTSARAIEVRIGDGVSILQALAEQGDQRTRRFGFSGQKVLYTRTPDLWSGRAVPLRLHMDKSHASALLQASSARAGRWDTRERWMLG
jgi:hypothetical protein